MIFSNKNSQAIIVLLTLMISVNCFSQKDKCENQTEIIKVILMDIQFENFLVGKDKINVENSVCTKIDIKIPFQKRNIDLIFLNKKIDLENKISFIEYEETDKIIFAKLSVFHNNAIFSLLLEKQNNNKLVLLKSWMKFIKRKN